MQNCKTQQIMAQNCNTQPKQEENGKRLWLIEKRHQQGVSQKEIATKIGISQNYYSWLEQGKRRPSPQIAQKIGKELDFPWVLFYGDGDEE